MSDFTHLLEELRVCEANALKDHTVRTPWEFGFRSACRQFATILRCYSGADGWIPLREQTPTVPPDLPDKNCPLFEVMLHGERRPCVLKCNSQGIWFPEEDEDREPQYAIIAWRPLPQKTT